MNSAGLSDELRAVLELARWAPSGDNTQPWRFEILGARRFVIHGHDTRDWCVYDLDGRASQIAIGALMETVALAASTLGLRADFRRRPESPEERLEIEVELVPDDRVAPDPLAEVITKRVTQRRPLATCPLTAVQKRALEESVGERHMVHWLETPAERWAMAKLLFRSAHIRLTIPEAYEVHRRVIEWRARTSEDRIPDKAVGLDPVGVELMRWAMKSWRRVRFLNRWMAGTWLPRIQLDLMPGYRCAAHALISAVAPPVGIDAHLAGGRAVQRFWLMAAAQGLQFQPEMTPLIFARYARQRQRFSSAPSADVESARLRQELEGLYLPERLISGVFLCRLGIGRYPLTRSTRKALSQLEWP